MGLCASWTIPRGAYKLSTTMHRASVMSAKRVSEPSYDGQTYLNAAYLVLAENKKEMHYLEITAIALERGLIEPSEEAKTPECTMNSAIGTDIRKNETTSFTRTSRGMYGLKEYPKLSKLQSSSKWGKIGENLVISELLYKSYTVYEPIVDDVGIDIIALKRDKTAYIQVKLTSKQPGRYVAVLNMKTYEKASAYNTSYVFVLRDGKTTEFVLLPKSVMEKIVTQQRDRGTVGNFSLRFVNRENELFLNAPTSNDISVQRYCGCWSVISESLVAHQ